MNDYYGDVVCPQCKRRTSKVVDSRGTVRGAIRRRRECLECQYRFTTYESARDTTQNQRMLKLMKQAHRLGQLLIETAKI